MDPSTSGPAAATRTGPALLSARDHTRRAWAESVVHLAPVYGCTAARQRQATSKKGASRACPTTRSRFA